MPFPFIALPYLDVVPGEVHPPSPGTPGRCPTCGLPSRQRWLLADNRVLQHRHETARRLVNQLATAPRARQTAQQRPPDTRLTLTVKQFLLNHLPPAVWENTLEEVAPLTDADIQQLHMLAATPETAVCAVCHSWFTLNGLAAAQGEMVWLESVAPADVVALNRRILAALNARDAARQAAGQRTLQALLAHRRPVRQLFGTSRPADFADVLRQMPPAARNPVRTRMHGLALVLTPASLHRYRVAPPTRD